MQIIKCLHRRAFFNADSRDLSALCVFAEGEGYHGW